MYYLSWFEIRQVGYLTYAIQEPGHFEEVISYLLVGTEKAILIDTGMGVGNIKDVVSSLTDKPITVINTSSNWEHIGGNSFFDEIAIHESEAAKLEKPPDHSFLKEQMLKGKIWRDFPDEFELDDYEIRPSKATIKLKDGDYLDLGDRLINIVHTPGNSPGSICILDSQHAQLFTGDTLYLGPLYAHLPSSNILDYHDSIVKLGSFSPFVEHILPGHNMTPIKALFIREAFDGFDKIMAKEVTHSEDELGKYFDFDHFRIYVKDKIQ